MRFTLKNMNTFSPTAPIGVFDSGIGGLSVLRALRAQLPHEHFVYLSDSRYTPYGERDADFIAQRALTIAADLQQTYAIKALVVACNTATAVAIEQLRRHYPQLLLVGVEPALKPAVQASRTGHIGVLGTRGTLGSMRFAQLLSSLQHQAQFVLQPCDGLALAIEQTVLDTGASTASDQVHSLLERYLRRMGCFGPAPGCMDTLVLGCTHYIFAQAALQNLTGTQVQLLETGHPVARQTQRLLEKSQLLAPAHNSLQAACTLITTGQADILRAAADRWLLLPAPAFVVGV